MVIDIKDGVVTLERKTVVYYYILRSGRTFKTGGNLVNTPKWIKQAVANI